MKFYWSYFILLFSFSLQAQKDPGRPLLDVLHYTFALQLNDDNNTIKGEASITIAFLQTPAAFDLDLYKKRTDGLGMTVSRVLEKGSPVSFLQEATTLHIYTAAQAGDTVTYTIHYAGIPADGLIIDKTQHGQRSFFGDNWPNRAHHWLPCIDHPADKASVDFIVTAPEHYQVVSNGVLVESSNLPGQMHRTHWQETVPLPTKVMTIGVAAFAVRLAGELPGIPVYSWVYPEDSSKGWYDYALAIRILPWFINKIGPYPYKKLANVQSKTRFGGMENAGAIFYAEHLVTGNRHSEALLAHEIAHQWFGNSATESSWPHIWLSEGMASFMTHQYLLETYGKDSLLQRMKEDRQAVIHWHRQRPAPVVDSSAGNDLFALLNDNSYKKGAWVLYMLQQQLGDAFWPALRHYYANFAGKNAGTRDFQAAVEQSSGKDLDAFFQQWLYRSGHPVLQTSWNYLANQKAIRLTIVQRQDSVYAFPLQVAVQTGAGVQVQTVKVAERTSSFLLPADSKTATIEIDPGVQLLFELYQDKKNR